MKAIQKEKILIGWDSQDITPEKTIELRGQMHVRISERVNDPLTLTALAIESEKSDEQAIMLSVDTCMIREEALVEIRDLLKQRLPEFNADKLVVNATHTHTAPPLFPGLHPTETLDVQTPREYTDYFVAKAVDACVNAWKSRALGAVSWGCGQAVVGFNRRATYLDGQSKMYGDTSQNDFSHIEGHVDHGVDMLFTYDENHILTGMIVNVPCPSQVTEGHSFISADYWHDTRCEIRKRHGNDLYILPQCGAAGDISPHLMLKKQAEARMLKLKGLYNEGDDYRLCERIEIANRITNAVDEVLPLASKDIIDELEFGHQSTILELPVRMVTEEEVEFSKEQIVNFKETMTTGYQDPASKSYSSAYRRTKAFQDVLDRFEEQKTQKTLPMEAHIIRLGDVAFATNRFELFLDYGQRMKARSKALQTFVVQLTGAGTYLPTQRAVDGKSYGAGIESNLVGPEGGQVLVDETVKMINKLFGE